MARRTTRWVLGLQLLGALGGLVAAVAPGCHSGPAAVTPPSMDGGSGGAHAASGATEAAARAQIGALLASYDIQESDLTLVSIFTDDLGYVHVRFQQSFHAVEVPAGQVIVQFRPDQSLYAITDALVSHVATDTQPTVTADAAIAAAAAAYGDGPAALVMPPPTPALVILRLPDGDHLAFEVRFARLDGFGLPMFHVDAHGGGVLDQIERLATMGTIQTRYNGIQTLQTTTVGGVSYLEQPYHAFGQCKDPNRSVRSGDTLGGKLVVGDMWPEGATPYWALEQAYLYYSTNYRYRLYDGDGGFTTSYPDERNDAGQVVGDYLAVDGKTPLKGIRADLDSVSVVGGALVNNCAFDPDHRVILCLNATDGVHRSFDGLDTIGHEATHGVLHALVKLATGQESGALHESYADVFGNMVELSVTGSQAGIWSLGEQEMVDGGADRYLDRPHRPTYNSPGGLPDHRCEYIFLGNASHENSGIPSQAFYLAAQGGTHRLGGACKGLDVGTASNIWFHSIPKLPRFATFDDARVATVSAAKEMEEGQRDAGATPGPLADTVALAWALVGVGDCDDKGHMVGSCPNNPGGAQPCCVQPVADCSADGQCCGSDAGTARCDRDAGLGSGLGGSCCNPLRQPCGSSIACCGGGRCDGLDAGVDSGTCCMDPTGPCYFNADCCGADAGAYCDDTSSACTPCTGGSGNCPVGGPNHCCVVDGVQQLCGMPYYPTDGGQQGQCCVPLGQPFTGQTVMTPQCCQPQVAGALHPASGYFRVSNVCCGKYYSTCTSDSDCCNGLPCTMAIDDISNWNGPLCCKPVRSPCTVDNDCCQYSKPGTEVFHTCNTTTQQCCLAAGSNCNGDANMCCSGTCSTGDCD